MKKRMLKFISLFLCVIACFGTGTPVLAADEPTVQIITPYSTSVPKDYWNLSNSAYNATLEAVGTAKLYTNYYFHASSSGSIGVEFSVSGGYGTLRIGAYDIINKEVAVYNDYEIPGPGKYDDISLTGLTPGGSYAVYFQSVDNFLYTTIFSGWATVY